MKKILFLLPFVLLAACGNNYQDKVQNTEKTKDANINNKYVEDLITDENGKSLYILKTDSYNKSTCYGKCAQNWPIYYNEKLKGNGFDTIIRNDGKKQTTYNGYPLYYYIKDEKPGDKYGDGKGNKWFLARKNMGKAPINMEIKNNVKTYTKEEVAKHNNPSDCWTIINKKVYSISSFFGKHPGGDDKLAKLCGKDGTELFINKHGNNEKAKMKLESFYIGDLVE